ncbi:MAG: hypothetical protein CMP91_02655 [Gammaproteobacteria bacterium]|nr:hypothetical protein [Gammaproteobacteria bacterium]MAY02436.1 hypothetical protein [Gammaproteobacteria bacterium]|tara:strand:- start:2747 stop:3457 length:711 start_codon:yes stop_codon:yes gene_type:complete
MSMKEPDDKNLGKYLQGKDKVSSTYAQLHSEKPSAEIDDRILQAARKAVEGQTQGKKTIPYQAYSIAASVCLMVLAAALFLDNEVQLRPQTFETRAIPQSDMPLDENAAAEAETFQADAIQATQRLEEARGAAEALNAPAASRVATQTAPESVEEVVIAAEQGLITEDAIVTQTLEAAPVATAYRENMDSWLIEIQRLQAIEPAQAAEEIRLFSEAYPDISVEDRLDELNENSEIN